MKWELSKFLTELFRFLFPAGSLKFTVASAVMGFIIVLVDYGAFKLKGTTYLKLDYKGSQAFLNFLWWGACAGLGGYIGLIAGLFQNDVKASLMVGVGWPFILPRLIEARRAEEEEQIEMVEEE